MPLLMGGCNFQLERRPVYPFRGWGHNKPFNPPAFLEIERAPERVISPGGPGTVVACRDGTRKNVFGAARTSLDRFLSTGNGREDAQGSKPGTPPNPAR